ncbi:S-layer homology domain-containing protein [Paenibacillus sp. 2TAB19]|uniref:S-layer homology domain-containing protein n=1 Tax=Paenibacillus sp. 2TAB19 TaxID=3233003 RepID=UPI003F958DCC
MQNYIKRSSYLLLLLVTMVLLSSCVSNASLITIHMIEDDMEDGLSLYGRFEDGTVTKAVYNEDGINPGYDDYIINNPNEKWVVGGYVTDGVMSWVPGNTNDISINDIITQTNSIGESKPDQAAAYAVIETYSQVGDIPAIDLNLGVSVHSEDGQLLTQGSTEVFATSTNSDINLYGQATISVGNVPVRGVSLGTSEGYVNFTGISTDVINGPPTSFLKLKNGSKNLPFSFEAKAVKKQTLRKGGASKVFSPADLATEREGNALTLLAAPVSSNTDAATADIVDGNLVIQPGTRTGNAVITVQVDNGGPYTLPVDITVQVVNPSVPDSPNTVNGLVGGTQSADSVTVSFPAGVADGKFKVDIVKITDHSSLPVEGRTVLVGSAYSITKDTTGGFDKAVTITMSIDPVLLDTDSYSYAIYWFDEVTQKWVKLDRVTVDRANGQVTGQTDHFTTFAVLGTELDKPEVIVPVTLTDIAGHWAEKSIVQLVGLGVLSGYPDGSFQPEEEITRAEFTTALVNALKLPVTGDRVFADTSGHWAQKQIAIAAENGIVGGYEGNLFKPDASVTREEIAVMVARAVDLKRGDNALLPKDAAAISPWAVDSVAALMEKGVISGYLDGNFDPKRLATRAEAAAIIVNTLNKLL